MASFARFSASLLALPKGWAEAAIVAASVAGSLALTDNYNRRRWVEIAEPALARSAATGAPVALLVLDVDRFKQINDAHGHNVGDAVLRAVAEACRDGLRPTDALARWGGEEFVMLLPHATLEQGVRAAERIRAAVAARVLRDLGLQVTASIGVVAAPVASAGYDIDQLLHLADRAMYAAKQAGRNQVHVAQVDTRPAAPARSA